MNWLECLEGMEEFYRWKREHHPAYPDLRLEWGLYHHLRGGLALEHASGEVAREGALALLAEGQRVLAEMGLDGCAFGDFHAWEIWAGEHFPREGDPPPAPGAEELREHFSDYSSLQQQALVRQLVKDIEPLAGLPAALRRCALCPSFRRLFAAMAEFQAHRGKSEQAATLYTWAVLTGRQLAKHWVYRVQWERVCGDVIRVEELLTEGLKHFPDDIELIREMAGEKDRQGEIGAAVTLLEKAVDLRPNWPDLRYDLARLYEESRNPEASLAQFSKALELNPGYEKAALSQAEALIRLGELEKAEQQLMELEQREIRSQRVYQMLSQIYAERGDTRRAEHFGVLGQKLPEDAGTVS